MASDLSSLQQRLQAALRAEGEEFTVGPLLGQGGFAAVFRARDEALHRDVAVKVLDLETAPSPSLAERFQREARTIAQLEHPNIVPIYKVGRRGAALLYIIMRCVDGPSLRQVLAARGRLSVADAARVARQVADALAHAHAQGVVHRDVKPDNVLIDRKSGSVLVTDFGIAKAAQAAAAPGASELTVEGMIIGTPQYMSPEQAAGEPVDARSDVYSLGVVLYQMLAGAPPFDGASAASILAQQLTASPQPIRARRPDVPAALAAILDRMLEKDPARRYQSAVEVSQALVEVLPAAARSRVKVRSSAVGTAVKYLVGAGLIGCLAALAFAAGAAVVLWSVFSSPARVSLAAPIPDSLAAALLRRGALARGDTATYVFQPGADEPAVLVLSRRAITVAPPPPALPRRYARDSVIGYDDDLRWEHGPRFLVALQLTGGRADTVYRNLSLRPYLTLAGRLGLIKVAAGGSGGVRIDRRERARR